MPKPTADRSPAHRIAERCFRIVDGGLVIGSFAAGELASQFGTPLFVYDRGVVEQRWHQLHDALHGEFDIYFSMKANPLQALLKFFVGRGNGIEVASALLIPQR